MRRCYLLLILVLVACSSVQPIPDKILHQTNDWRIAGKLGVRSPDYNGSVSIHWQNTEDNFVIALSGALGLSVARIEGNDDSIVLTTPDESVRLTNQQLKAYLGYDLPLDYLDFWIRGIADPDRVSTIHPTGFTQAGWKIDYLKYKASNPVMMRLSQGATFLTLAIHRWEY